MSKCNDSGIRQRNDGYWEYRFTIVVNGTRISKKKGTDELGNKLRTKRDAKKAREAAMVAARNEREPKKIIIGSRNSSVIMQSSVPAPKSSTAALPT
mgnify:CR=1 FL=1